MSTSTDGDETKVAGLGDRTASAVPSSVFIKSDRSMVEPTKLGGEPVGFDARTQAQRAPSPAPSGVSLKSDRSMLEPPKLSDEPVNFDQSVSRTQTQRAPSPVPSGVSLKSDRSMLEPPKLSDEPVDFDQRTQAQRAPSPAPSGVSLRSMLEPPKIASESSPDVPRHLLNDPASLSTCKSYDDNLNEVIACHKASLKKRFENIRECVLTPATQTTSKRLYIDLYVTEGESEWLGDEHEAWQVESASTAQTTEDTPINCNDIFKPVLGEKKHIKTVLTKGVACIGKTVLVQKFIFDWASGEANQNIDFVFLLPFRFLNRIKDSQYSLHQLLLDFYPELQKLTNSLRFKDCQILFICFALDESSLPLDFLKNKKLSDVTEISMVDSLITSLIQGSLLPSAHIWITSRPVASNQIPPECISKITEVRGFTDSQKEEYFKKRVSDEDQANRIISCIKASRSLQMMCRLPVFCSIAATVLQQTLKGEANERTPTTLTEMLMHFLLIQTTRRSQKYQASTGQESASLMESQSKVIMKLSELAYWHLQRGNFIFSEKEVQECGLDLNDAMVCSGLCTDILKGESALFDKVYTFVHVTIQEFLAALYVFVSFVNKNEEALKPFLMKSKIFPVHLSLDELLKNAVKRALESKSGQLDLFVRFLHGISLESNQRLLQGLLIQSENNPVSVKKAAQNLKEMRRQNISPDRWINLFHCLVEMQDSSVHEDVQAFLKSEKGALKKLKLAHCSALANVLLMAEKPLDELDLKKYKTSDEGRRRLIPAVRTCKKAQLAGCKLTEKCYDVVAMALESAHSPLIQLDLSHNNVQKSEERLLRGLLSQHCKLESLRLAHCKLSKKSCEILASALQLETSALRELDLSDNNLQESVTPIFRSILNPNSKLESLSLAGCKLTATSCKPIASVLQAEHSLLRELDMSKNHLQDSGAEHLSSGLGSLNCYLETLRLSACDITEKGYECLASALSSNPSHLRELDLSYNHPGDTGIKMLLERQNDPNSALETLNFS